MLGFFPSLLFFFYKKHNSDIILLEAFIFLHLKTPFICSKISLLIPWSENLTAHVLINHSTMLLHIIFSLQPCLSWFKFVWNINAWNHSIWKLIWIEGRRRVGLHSTVNYTSQEHTCKTLLLQKIEKERAAQCVKHADRRCIISSLVRFHITSLPFETEESY